MILQNNIRCVVIQYPLSDNGLSVVMQNSIRCGAYKYTLRNCILLKQKSPLPHGGG